MAPVAFKMRKGFFGFVIIIFRRTGETSSRLFSRDEELREGLNLAVKTQTKRT